MASILIDSFAADLLALLHAFSMITLRINQAVAGLAGVGGAYYSLTIVPTWVDGLTKGVGWIAIALVIFGFWRPGVILAGAY